MMTFDDWFQALSTLYASRYGELLYDKDKPDWKEYYDCDYTVRDALDDEQMAGYE